jgi:hypothetical protein
MSKRIKNFRVDPLSIQLDDKYCSLIVDHRNGNILFNEGDGDDRMNGAYYPADNSPRFAVAPRDGEYRLEVNCRGFNWPVGTTADETAAREWAAAANAILVAFDTPTTPDIPNPTESDERRPEATPAVSDSEKYA